MNLLFVAEKNSEMRAVQETYNAHRQEIETKVGHIDFVALSGHVTRYKDPKEYPQWSMHWDEIKLPMIPDEHIITRPLGGHAEEVLGKFESLLKKAHYDALICGTDPDVEGNGIFYNLARYEHLTGVRTYRFFASSLTDGEILKAILNMTDFYRNPRDVKMTENYLLRSQFDWEVGMNATVGITLKKARKRNEVMRVGRVKAPTIKLVYDNSKAIDEFTPHSEFLAQLVYIDGFTGTYVDSQEKEIGFETKEQAEKFLNDIDKCIATVTKVEKKTVRKNAPELFRLSTLQAEAGAKFNYTPDETLEIAQALYEKRLLSYPRTDCNYVTKEMAEKFGSLLKSAYRVPELKEYINTLDQEKVDAVKMNPSVVSDEEVSKSAHDALLPTENAPEYSSLSEKEKNIYSLVCGRLVAQFMPQLVEEKTKIIAEIDDLRFKSMGSAIIEEGWTKVLNAQKKEELIPKDIKKEFTLVIQQKSVHERKSEPPKRLTMATLVSAMENISKYIDNKELKSVMKDARGIGTPATRATIIKDILDTGYMTVKGKSNQLYITELGIRYIEALKGFSIIEPVAAATWEALFLAVRNGYTTYTDAKKKTHNYIIQFMAEISKLEQVEKEENPKVKTGIKCPECGGDIIRYDSDKWHGYMCSNWKKEGGCRFIIYDKDNLLTSDDITALVTNGETRIIDGLFYNIQKNKYYPAALKLGHSTESEKLITYKFPEREQNETAILCPYCKSNIIKNDWGYQCKKRLEKKCGFVVFNKQSLITDDDIKELTETGSTRKIKNIVYSPKKKKYYTAKLKLEPNGSENAVSFIF